MKILYIRTSTFGQNAERQKTDSKGYQIIEDKCSGKIAFFEREGGKKIKAFAEEGKITELVVHQIDRLGRNLVDILQTINYFNQKQINIVFKQQGLQTLNADGSENDISKMVISILGVVAEMERKMILERQAEGIAIAKANGRYKGRRKGTTEGILKFLSKPKNEKALQLLEKGYKNVEVAKIVGLHPNTIGKIKKLNEELNICNPN